jgi:TRAP-type mannitol/chloroaromatic compound transport system substrate-binding protein
MGGWFRNEIISLDQLKDITIRIPGLGARVWERLGASTATFKPNEIARELRKNSINAAEWIGPYDDEKLGFNKVAPYYYTPGWWEAGAQLSFYVGIKEWEKLPKLYQHALEVATYEAHITMQAMYDARNPQALARLLKNGAKMRSYSKSIMDACHKSAIEVMNEEASKNAKFKKIMEPWKRFRQDQNQWYSVAEAPIQNYLISRK